MRKEELEIVYVAGLFDGEGCITVEKSKRKSGRLQYQLALTLTNTHIITLLEVQGKWGGRIRIQYREGWKPLGHLIWRARKAAELLRKIQPFLRIKREQCQIALAFVSLLNPLNHRSKRLTSEDCSARDALIQELSILKRQ